MSSPLAKEVAMAKASQNSRMEEGENQKRVGEKASTTTDLLGGPMEFNSETASEPLSETFNNTQMANGGGGGGGMPSNHHQMNGTNTYGRLVEM